MTDKSRLKPGRYLPVANKTQRTIEVFYVDAIISMTLAWIVSEAEGSGLMDRVSAWVDRCGTESEAAA